MTRATIDLPELQPGDWVTTGSLRVDTTLTLSDLDSAPLLHDARTLLGHLARKRQLDVGENGRLTVAVLSEIRPALRWVEPSIDFGLGLAPGETDLRGLWVARTLLTSAHLIFRELGRLHPTRRAETLGVARRAGELFATLFIQLFHRTGPGFLDPFDAEERGLRTAIPSILYLLSQRPDGWQSADELAVSTWPPALRPAQERSLGIERFDPKPLTFALRVLDPLVAFGLMEQQVRAADGRRAYRATPLLRRFLSFEGTLG